MSGAHARPTEQNLATVFSNRTVLRALAKPGVAFDRAGLLAEIFAALDEKSGGAGGQAALAKILVDELTAGKPGAVARQRTLDTICRLINWHSDDVRQAPVEEMSEAELISSIAAALPQLRVLARPPSRRNRRSRPAPPRDPLEYEEVEANDEDLDEILDDEPCEPFN